MEVNGVRFKYQVGSAWALKSGNLAAVDAVWQNLLCGQFLFVENETLIAEANSM